MKEYLIVSGRDIDILYPHLNVWGFGIPLYLFIGGLAAGILIFATLFYLMGKDKEFPVTVKIATMVPPLIIALGLLFLIGDLRHKPFFWQLLTHFRLQSPMNWGAWTLTIVFILSLLWPLSFIDDMIEYFQQHNRKKWANAFIWIKGIIDKVKIFRVIVDWFTKNRKAFAIITMIFSIILGIYTGILLSTMNARPLWNTPILGLLFLTSGISTATVTIMWITDNEIERKLFTKIDFYTIILEMYLIFQLFFNMIQGPEIQVKTAQLFFGGEFTAIFWALFVMLGLVVPWILEILELKGWHVPVAVPAFLILYGGLVFRYIMVYAGEISSFLPTPTILH